MARIKSYVQDTNVTDQDRILGTSYEGILNNKPIYKTVNYDITALASYFSQNFDFEGVNYNLAEIKDFQINLANSLGDVNLDGSLANISVNFANDLIALVQNTSFPQGLADYIVSIAALNEAFANQVLDLATSTAYATKDSFDSLSAFVDQIDTNVQGLDVSVSNVVADTDANTGAITANATAITALGVRTTTAEADVVALQTDFTSLETVVNTNTGSISTNATTISSLGTVVDTATIDIATLKTDVTLLESEIDTVAGTASANASDISLLTTNLNTLAGDVTAVQTDVTVLQSDVDTNTNDISTQATQVSLLANRVTTAEADILNTSTNVTNLGTTVNGNTGAISTNAANISILQSDVTTAQTQVTALQTNVTLLETEVDDAANTASANATNIQTLSATVDDNTASVSSVSTAVADIEGNLSASYALTVDAGGRVAGLKLLTNGSTGSEFIARANTFAVDMPNGTRVLTVNSGGLTIVGSGTFSGNLSAAGGTFNGNLVAAGGTFSGNLSAAGGTFSGSLSAVGGTFTGDLSAAGGTFNGNLVAAGGTFSGNLSAAGGTFNGDLSAAGGTFSGNLSAAGGTFTGALSAATGSFAGQVTAGIVDINNGVITIGYNFSTANGKISFLNSGGSEVTRIKSYSFTSPNGGGIDIAGTIGTNPGTLRLGCDSSGLGIFDIEANGTRIYTNNFGGNKILQFYSDNSNYRFSGLYFKNVALGTSLYVNGSGDIGGQTSSRRFKENIIDYNGSIDDVNKIRTVRFNYKEYPEIPQIGMIAEEMHDAGLTDFVRYDENDEPFTIAYEQLVVLLTKGMQEQQEQIDALKAEIELLKAQ